MQKIINFYHVSDEYGCFSNFSPHPVVMDGKLWPTSEHYFQAQKFNDVAYQEKIRQAKTPRIAARMGRDLTKQIRLDWEAVKLSIMRDVIREKFKQHADIRQILISTGDAIIIEHTANDSYWGDGGDGSGKNMLGRILTQVRDEF